MATRNITIVVRALGTRSAARQIEQTGNAIEKVGYKAVKSGEQIRHMGESMRTAGHAMSHGITAPIVGLGAVAVNEANKFQQAMTRIQTQAGVSAQTTAEFRKQILALGGKTTQGPTELAKALFHISSVMSGRPEWKTEAQKIAGAMNILKTSSTLAQIGGSNLEATSSAVSAAYVVQMKDAKSLDDVASILNATVGQGNMTMAELVTVMGTGVLPVAKEAGLGFKDIATAVALLTDEGMKASTTGNLLRTSFHFLTSPSDRARKAMAGIGLTSGDLAADMQKPNGLLTALKDLASHLNTAGDTAAKNDILGMIFPTGRGTPMHVLLNQLNMAMGKQSKIAEHATKANLDAAKAASDATPGVKAQKAWGLMQNTMVRLGDDILPIVVPWMERLAHVVDDLARAWDNLDKSTKTNVIKIAAIAALIGPAVVVLGTFVAAAGTLWRLVGTIGGGIGSVARLFGWKGKGGKGGLGGLGGLGGGTHTGVMTVQARIVNVYGGVPGAGRLPGGAGKLGKLGRVGKLAASVTPAGAVAVGGYEVIHQMGWDKGHARRGAMGLGGVIADPTSVNKSGRPVATWNPSDPSVTGNLGLTGHMASGGMVSRGGMYEVGERGSEVVHLPAGAGVQSHGDGGQAVHITSNLVVDSKVLATAVNRAVLKKASTR
jgi:TP901 family phage tail tape measure protein